MDLLILVILLLIVILFFKRFSNVVYFIGIVDIFFRLFHIMKANIEIKEVVEFLNKLQIPTSIPGLLAEYSTGILYTILVWGYIIIMWIFLSYVTKTFIKRKK